MNERDRNFVLSIIKEIDTALRILGDVNADEFNADIVMNRAVCMTLINIGELIKSVSPELRSANPDIPWREAAGLRDITAHKYYSLHMDDVWATVKFDLPSLKTALTDIISSETD